MIVAVSYLGFTHGHLKDMRTFTFAGFAINPCHSCDQVLLPNSLRNRLDILKGETCPLQQTYPATVLAWVSLPAALRQTRNYWQSSI